MALIRTSCGTGVVTGQSPESAAEAQAIQTDMIGMEAGVVNAQAAANSLYTRSPQDYADLGPNVMVDVARTNLYGAGGPAGKSGPIAYSAWGVPFGPLGNRAAGDRLPAPCDTPAPVQLVPLTSSISLVRQPKLTTTQGLDTPPTACVRPARTGNICMDIALGLVASTEVSTDVLWACNQKGYAQAGVHSLQPCVTPGAQIQVSQAELDSVPPYQAAAGLSGFRRRGMGDAYPMQGPYPVSCSPAAPNTGGAVSISPGWWLALIGLGLVLAVGGSAGRVR